MQREAQRWGRRRGNRFPRGRLPVLACFLALNVWGANESNLEYRVKAAFLLNFTRFVEWPPSAFADAQAPLSICILGEDPFGHALEEVMQGESVNGRSLIVRRLSAPPTPQMCQILFIHADAKAEAKEALRALETAGKGVLTVGEGDGFLKQGGMIAFVLDNRRVRFDINGTVSQDSGLKISSKLLMVARSVTK